MKSDELCWQSATELAGQIRKKKVSPVEVVDAVLDRIERLNPRLNAYVTVTAESARKGRPGGRAGARQAVGGGRPNMTGQPAASVPAGFTEDGLPVGLQIVGRRFDDVTMLRAAAAFERARPWVGRRPPNADPR